MEVLTPEIVLHAYRLGLFPMGDPSGEVFWFSPDPRAVFELDNFRVHRSLRQRIRRGDYEIRIDAAFGEVMAACGERREGTWISPEIRGVYHELHDRGYAHSVETWMDDELAGGLYGVALGGAFFGESMFFRRRDASKVALSALVEHLRTNDFTLLDTQWSTPHLARLGAKEISRDEYMRRLQTALEQECAFPRRFSGFSRDLLEPGA